METSTCNDCCIRPPTCKNDENRNFHSNHGNGGERACASAKICEQNFDRFFVISLRLVRKNFNPLYDRL